MIWYTCCDIWIVSSFYFIVICVLYILLPKMLVNNGICFWSPLKWLLQLIWKCIPIWIIEWEFRYGMESILTSRGDMKNDLSLKYWITVVLHWLSFLSSKSLISSISFLDLPTTRLYYRMNMILEWIRMEIHWLCWKTTWLLIWLVETRNTNTLDDMRMKKKNRNISNRFILENDLWWWIMRFFYSFSIYEFCLERDLTIILNSLIVEYGMTKKLLSKTSFYIIQNYYSYLFL